VGGEREERDASAASRLGGPQQSGCLILFGAHFQLQDQGQTYANRIGDGIPGLLHRVDMSG
jgi:hypothetical protein